MKIMFLLRLQNTAIGQFHAKVDMAPQISKSYFRHKCGIKGKLTV